MKPSLLAAPTIALLREIERWPDDDRALLFAILEDESPETQLRLSRALRISGDMRTDSVIGATSDAIAARYCVDCGQVVKSAEDHDCPADEDEDDEEVLEELDAVGEKKENAENRET